MRPNTTTEITFTIHPDQIQRIQRPGRATRRGRFNEPFTSAWDKFVRHWFLILWILAIATVVTIYLVKTR